MLFSRKIVLSLLVSSLLCLNTAVVHATTTVAAVWLVDAKSGKDLLQLSTQAVNTINIKDLSNSLTIRADALQDSAASCLLFDWNDGEFQRTVAEAPYYMGGSSSEDDEKEDKNNNEKNDSATMDEVKALTKSEAGMYQLTVSAADCDKDVPLSRGHGKPLDENSATANTEPLPRTEDDNAEDYVYAPVEDVFLPAAPATSNNGNGKNKKKDDDEDHDRARNLSSLLSAPSDSLTFQIEIVDRRGNTGAILPDTDVPDYKAAFFGALNGPTEQYAKLTFGFAGPIASEAGMTIPLTSESQTRKPSTFMDYRLDVSFTHVESGTHYLVPGYYAGRGSTTGTSGNIWLCHFRPLLAGAYEWQSEFVEGTGVAASPNGGGNPAGFFHSLKGSFDVAAADTTTRGMLAHVGQHQLQFLGNGEYFVERPATGLPNLLASSEFDATAEGSDLKQYRSHYKGEAFTWNKGQGKAVLGAVNSAVQQQEANMLTVKLVDSGSGVTPFRIQGNYLDYKISKLAQWEALFDYCDYHGLALNLQLGDMVVDGHALDVNERALYLREMVARFGHHLAVTWDLAAVNSNPDTLIETSQLLKKIDPYHSPIMVHADEDDFEALLGASTIDGVHLMSSSSDTDWETRSEEAGHAWVVRVANEEGGRRLRGGHR